MPEWPGVGVGLREDGVEVGDAGVGDEALAPVEDVLVAVRDAAVVRIAAESEPEPASVSA